MSESAAAPPKEHEEDGEEGVEEAEAEADIKVTPIVKLVAVDVKTGEEDEEEIHKVRAKLFRWGMGNAGLQWKERGTGEVKLLKHKENGFVRLLMRRDKILSICANHRIGDEMVLGENQGSDRSWVYKCYTDYSDGECVSSTLAIRFKDPEIADAFKVVFDTSRENNARLRKASAPPSPKKKEDEGADAKAEDKEAPESAEKKEDKAPESEAKKEDAAVDEAAKAVEALKVEETKPEPTA